MKNKIRQARLMRGMTQSELAEKVGTTAATISRLEKDSMTVSTEWLDRLSAALGLHAAELLEKSSSSAIPLLGKATRTGRVILGATEEIPLEIPTADAVAIEVGVAQGPYRAGERLIGERLSGASTANGVGRDCIVSLSDQSILLARVIGTPPRFTLVPADENGIILYDQEISWLAPILMRVQYVW